MLKAQKTGSALRLVDSESTGGPAPTLTFEERIDAVFSSQKKHQQAMAATGARERREMLRRVLEWVEDHGDDIRRAGYEDFKKPGVEVDLTEIMPVVSEARFAMKRLRRWMRPRRVARTLALASTQGKVLQEPRGVVLILSPWNYPFNLTIGPMISALAAGNCVVLKPSESTPHMSALLGRLVSDLFEPHQVALFEGEVEVAKALLDKPFDHIFFTGSPAVGRRIMEAASRHLTSVTLELGGKSPVLVDETAHLPDAASKIAFGKWVNAGQTCIAPDYALVHRDRVESFIEHLTTELQRSYGLTPEQRRNSKDLASIVNRRQFDRLSSLLDSSLKSGAEVAFGGQLDESSMWMEPTLLTGVDVDSPIMHEEIFGPLLPILVYDDLSAALELIRSRPKPLALYVFSRRRGTVDRVLAETSAGGSCVNEVAVHFLHPHLPFGGVNHSGHGSAHGYYGFRAFSHERAVLTHHRFSALKMLSPPYTDRVKSLVKLTQRII